MAYTGPERRNSRASPNRDQILSLMRDSADPSYRAVLAVILDLSQTIESIQQVVEELRQMRLDYAKDREEAIEHKGSARAWAAGATMLSTVALAVVTWFALDHLAQGTKLTFFEARQVRVLQDLIDMRQDQRELRAEIREIAQRQAGGTRGP